MAHVSPPCKPRFSSNQKLFLIFILIVSNLILFIVLSRKYERSYPFENPIVHVEMTKPTWIVAITKGITNTNDIMVGLVNIDARVDSKIYQQLHALEPKLDFVSIPFDHVNKSLKWDDFFPKWIDEEGDQPKYLEMPMPRLKDYEDVNVIVAKVPCVEEGIRDVFRLQVNLVVANLAVESGWVTTLERDTRKVYVVFVGSCGPMVEIFRCDDLLIQEGEYWVYQPDLNSLKHQMVMPGYAKAGTHFS
ncbi:hypothetical protein Lalb_Chr04g0260771 [Lupinus albus]|uniref:Hexosyltransferase n=1 Tax=Lupinus albus TaxID=3870 RepID=A0A6A4QQY3_LUPAL|nr:hypothetical protein Lalb_Chr04g0260771 [Lupinus albus]